MVPPPADVIDSAHINGTPIFGNLFLDGYHGLTKEMLKDFLSKNSDGSYKIVDILINIANYNGFDGWFINNEPNGAAPNGTVLDYNVMAEIIKEFNYKVDTASDPNIQSLKIIFYRNGATVSKSVTGYNDIETLKMADSGYRKANGEVTPTDIQLTFGETPDKTTSFLTDYPNYSFNFHKKSWYYF
ncbi:endo-beta-N-acetylglucosaminidase [Spiroplasma endosymbiont of Zeiraphera isertana]|uniref:endo-beta-N-acetylglucosaminidase n=1 Tax=Spiroplasma endosymbiont of Zeiraphera isertana TaxID=3066313 RepID=UPI00313B8D46